MVLNKMSAKFQVYNNQYTVNCWTNMLMTELQVSSYSYITLIIFAWVLAYFLAFFNHTVLTLRTPVLGLHVILYLTGFFHSEGVQVLRLS